MFDSIREWLAGMGTSRYTPPQPVGSYKDLGVPREKMKIVDRVLTDLSERFGTEPPLRGTISGVTSVYRWGPMDLMMSERLLNEASDTEIAKVTAHEWFHSRQDRKHKIMSLHPIREAEAEYHALKYTTEGVAEDVPFFPFVNPAIFNHGYKSKFNRMIGVSGYNYERFNCTTVDALKRPRARRVAEFSGV